MATECLSCRLKKAGKSGIPDRLFRRYNNFRCVYCPEQQVKVAVTGIDPIATGNLKTRDILIEQEELKPVVSRTVHRQVVRNYQRLIIGKGK
jgi:hypothetical protein